MTADRQFGNFPTENPEARDHSDWTKSATSGLRMMLNSPIPRIGLLGLLLSGCVPHTHPDCHSQCALPQPREYCYDIPKGYVLAQDKYDPSFVPCEPHPVPPGPPGQDDDDGDDDDDDDDDDGTEDQGSSTGGGNGADAFQGDQQSEATAGKGSSAHEGSGTPSTAQSTDAKGGAGATATSGSVSSTANAGALL